MNLTAVERKTRLIGAILVERGLITPVQLKEALELQASRGGILGEIVTAEFGVSQVQVSQVIAEQLAVLEGGTAADPSPAAPTPVKKVGQRLDRETYVRIGDALLELGLVNPAQIEAALELQRQNGERLGEILVGQGVISRLELAGALSEHWSSLTKLRGPGEPALLVETAPPKVAAGELEALATLLERVDAKLDVVSRVAGGDGNLAAEVERLSAKIDVFATAQADQQAAQVERLSARFDELVDAAPLDKIGALGEGQHRGEEILGQLVSELAALREAADAKFDAIAAVAGGGGEVAGEVVRLSARLEELVGMAPSAQLAAEVVAQIEQMSGRLQELVAGRDLRDLEVASEFERLSVRFDELAAAVPSDQVEALGEGQRRGEAVLGQLVSELAALREAADAKFDAIAAVAGGGELAGQVERLSARLEDLVPDRDGEVAGQLERLSVRFDELVAAVPSDQLGALDEGQRRGEEILARLVADLAGAREETDAKLDAIAGGGGGDQEIAAEVARLSANMDKLATATAADRLVERLGSLGEGQRRGEEMLDGIVSELAVLREETDAKLEEIASAAAARSAVAAGEFEALAAALEGVGAGLEERGAGRYRELAAQVEQLSTRLGELAASGASELADRIDALAEAQRRSEETLERLLIELVGLRETTEARPEPTDLGESSSDGAKAKRKKKKKR